MRHTRFGGLLLSLCALLCGACTHDSRADPDTLVVAMSTFSEGTFLPWNGSTGRKFYLDTIYEYLAYLDTETLEPQPGLALGWDISADGRTFTLRLRHGVQFQEGWGELSAHDVKYTLDRIVDPRSIAGPASPLRKSLESVEVLDRYTVRIRLKTPDIGFIAGYLSNGLIVPIVSKRYVETQGDDYANAHPIGTGPFRLTGFRKGVSIEVTRAAGAGQHWRVQPAFERIRFLEVPEEFTRAAMLKTGELDLAPVNYDSIAALERSGVRMIYIRHNWAPVVRLGGLVPRFPSPHVPWRDRRVRQAMNFAIDKEAIARYIFHGQATPVGADFPAPEWTDIPPYPYDPGKARRLLAEAGYSDGFDITLQTYTTSPGAELPIVAAAVALYWQAVGLRVKIVPSNWTTLRGAWTTGKASDIVWTHRGLAFSGTLSGLHASLSSASVFAAFANEATDAGIERIEQALDSATRSARIRQLGLDLREEAPTVFIAFANEPYGASAKVGHWPALSQQGTNIDLITR